jgi:hypothetical protein
MRHDMTIEFSDIIHEADDGGVHFSAVHNNENLCCRISMEALKDINPNINQNDLIGQFKLYQDTFLSILTKKIIKNNFSEDVVWVLNSDIQSK